LRVLIVAFILSLICLVSAIAGEPVFSSKGVSLTYDDESGVYEVYKNGKLDSKRVIQSYEDIIHMNKLLKKLGATPNEELTLALNNKLMKSLKPPSEEQLVEVGVGSLELLTKAATLPVDQGAACSVQSDKARFKFSDKKKTKTGKKKGWFCATPSEKDLSFNYSPKKEAAKIKDDRTFMNHWMGGNIKNTITLDTYNDNFLHGGGIALTGDQTADDRARTYGHALQYEAEGDDGSFRMRYSSNLFTRLSPNETAWGGQDRWTDDNKLRLDAMEETTLFLRGTKNFDSDKNTYGIGSLSFRERTDENRGSQALQDSWHGMSGSVKYDYKDFMDEEYSLELKAGVGKKFEGDLGKWRCKAVVEGLVGIDAWTMDRAEAEVFASVGLDSGKMGGREADNPWLALEAYTRQSIDTDGLHESHYGAKVSTSFKWGESRIKPYLGVELIDEESDRMFQTADEGNELIHTIGIQVSF
jgi:hypothetical protein